MLFAFAAPVLKVGRSGPERPAHQNALLLLATLAHWLSFASTASAANDPIDLRPATQPGSHRQAKAIVEVQGMLKLNADGHDVKHLPIQVQAELQYAERVLSASKNWSDVRLVRSFQSAQAKIKLHETDLANELRLERRLIVVESSATSATQFSPNGPLTREELELIATPASGLALEALLPAQPTKIGNAWKLDDNIVARLLGLEAVNEQDMSCTLDSVKDQVAIISLAGKITGAVGGVSSDVELKGKLNFDLKQRAVTWLTLAYKENRAIGHAQPGFEVLTTLRLVLAPCKPAAELSDKALAGMTLKPSDSATMIELNSESGGFQVAHDRRWSVMLERNDLTVLRLIDRGDLVAQCNITPQPPLAKDQQLTMAGFQDDVKRVLGKNFEEIVEASEETGDNGLRVLRCVVAGKVGDLAIQWTYYHLADDAGHRASLVFTIESSILERFAHIDRELIGNFRFLPDKNPTPAADNVADPSAGDTASRKVGVLR